MRIRISYTTEVSDAFRRAIRFHYGHPGLATRAEVKDWIVRYGETGDDDLMYALQQAIERGDEEAI